MSISTHKRRLLPLSLLATVVLTACGQSHQGAYEQQAPAVETMTVQPRPLTISSQLPGRIEAARVAEVRARVAGIVLSRNFEEGADVKAGQVLFRIDPAPFKAVLSRAQAGLARAEATLADAQMVVKRYTPLVSIDAVSQQDFDAAQTALKAAQAERQSARAEVETAQLNLSYATVTAPIAGRIGRAQVTEGALVGQNEATPLATIQQIDAVYADFRQPVADAQQLRAAAVSGQKTGEASDRITLKVEGSGQEREGRLLFSDISVDQGTGQVLLRGKFPNTDGMLLPGMYVRVTTVQGTDPKAILVPQRAVQRSADGSAQVLVIGADDVAQSRPVNTGAMYGAQWHITQGLQAGDRVVIGGNAAPGAKVKVKVTEKDEAPPAASALPAASSTLATDAKTA
ncbi:efflux RND transporter periplasmic adaptor subunit [Comamonas sp.]|uniref:efflux RND transporter periplasmic adaptor subunit n=1 Tax=Comamonas sp. TaxID=34028 RepID=UPI00258CEBC0|nr:efflux RND transporter periplasmic adaptor subunit [Comamonas sp.]